jgi:adenosylmethionine-8-amino-7-oxononanoate aminotransferase
MTDKLKDVNGFVLEKSALLSEEEEDMTAHRSNENHVFYRNPSKFYPTADWAKGIYTYDTEGKRYIDGSNGAVVAGIRHAVREVVNAMPEQAGRIAFAPHQLQVVD